MEERLRRVCVTTLGELVALPPGPLRARFAGLIEQVAAEMDGRTGAWLGRDRPAFLEHDPEGATGGSISNERTFAHDVGDPDAVERQLLALVERVCWRARSRGIRARTVTLRLRWADFVTVTRGRTLATPTFQDADVWPAARALLRAAQDERPAVPVRLVGAKLSGLVLATQLELPLAAPPPGAVARATVDNAVDEVRDRYGFDAIRLDGRQLARRAAGATRRRAGAPAPAAVSAGIGGPIARPRRRQARAARLRCRRGLADLRRRGRPPHHHHRRARQPLAHARRARRSGGARRHRSRVAADRRAGAPAGESRRGSSVAKEFAGRSVARRAGDGVPTPVPPAPAVVAPTVEPDASARARLRAGWPRS
jgi:hypothetical protein